MISIIYPYRNRDIQRIKYSLDSLKQQTSKDFIVYFVNYGSEELHSEKVKFLLSKYPFVNYSYLYTCKQPWNKSKAINSVLRQLENGRFFVADIDLIFHPNFIEKATGLKQINECWYFQVGLLDKDESKQYKEFEAYKIKFKSDKRSTGLTLCSVDIAKSIRGFDEFYHFWGSEDTDLHLRLSNLGHPINFYDQELLLLHQWHKTYRSRESKLLTKELQVSGIVQFNQYYLQKAITEKKTIVNDMSWGITQSKETFEKLKKQALTNSKQLSNKQTEIDYLLFQELPNLKSGLHSFEIIKSKEYNSLKNSIKKSIGKNTPAFYSLKKVNDLVLFHIINFYRNNSYNYYITKDLKKVKFDIYIA